MILVVPGRVYEECLSPDVITTTGDWPWPVEIRHRGRGVQAVYHVTPSVAKIVIDHVDQWRKELWAEGGGAESAVTNLMRQWVQKARKQLAEEKEREAARKKARGKPHVYRCPKCKQRATIYMLTPDPPWCNNRQHVGGGAQMVPVEGDGR